MTKKPTSIFDEEEKRCHGMASDTGQQVSSGEMPHTFSVTASSSHKTDKKKEGVTKQRSKKVKKHFCAAVVGSISRKADCIIM